ncbi:MAG: TetR/AcrR family transcriptional regulator [Gammaproteobacteria bacterium]|nr:TetR family transcriptional regulator [Gammaproteobacteria bacterium]
MMNDPEHAFTERALKQRERILEAARLCFLKRGFHGASIADIAHEAGMSPGLIYRYFPSKQAIIKAIIERQLESGRRALEEIKSAEDFVQGILNAIEHWRSGCANHMNAPLFLEISAEATRDPEIAATVEEADRLIKNHLLEAMQRTARSKVLYQDPRRANARILLLMSVVEGLAIRACRDPQLDPDLLRCALTKFIAGLQADEREYAAAAQAHSSCTKT